MNDLDDTPLDRNSYTFREIIGQRKENAPRTNPRNVTASANVNPLDDEIRVDATGGARTMTLETAIGADGRRHTIKKIDSSANAVTIACTGAETLDGAATLVLSNQYDSAVVISNGTTWDVESKVVAGFPSSAWASFTPSRTGWTDVGSPTVTGRYRTSGKAVDMQVKVVPATTVATVAGTSYIAFPVTLAGLSGIGTMTDLTTLVSIGACVVDVANSRCYVPAQIATGDTLTIWATGEIA